MDNQEESMNILIINMFYYPNIKGGTENSIKLLAENLVKVGHNVYVYTQDAEKESIEWERLNGVNVYRSYSKAALNRWKYGRKNYSDIAVNRLHFLVNNKALEELKNIIEQQKINVIHTNNLVTISYSIWKYAQQKKIRIVHTLRDYWLLDSSTVLNNTNSILTYFHRLFFKHYSNYPEIVTAPSNCTLKLFESFGYFKHSKKVCVPNCIEYDEKKLIDCIKYKSNRTSNSYILLYVGRLSENKGIMHLVDAFLYVSLHTNKKVELRICGDGPLHMELQKIANEHSGIVLCGPLNEEDLSNEYKNADILVVPSVWEEPFGRIVIEGAQYALPVIGSNRGGIPEIVETLKNGECIDPCSEKELREYIIKFCNRRIIREYIDKLPDTLQGYSVAKQICAFEKIYNMLLK